MPSIIEIPTENSKIASTGGTNRCVAINSSGHYIARYASTATDHTDAVLSIKTSTDAGQTWGSPELVYTPATGWVIQDGPFPSICIDNNDKIHITLVLQLTGGAQYKGIHVTNATGSWVEYVSFTSVDPAWFSVCCNPVVDSNNDVMFIMSVGAAWTYPPDPSSFYFYKILSAGTWETPELILTSADISGMSLAITSTDELHGVYHVLSNPGYPPGHLWKTTGWNFEVLDISSLANYEGYSTHIIITSDDQLHIFSQSYGTGNSSMYCWHGVSETWDPPELVVENTADYSRYMGIPARDQDDNLYLPFTEETLVENTIWLKKYTSLTSTWEEPVRLYKGAAPNPYGATAPITSIEITLSRPFVTNPLYSANV